MIVYHGSNREIRQPDVLHSRENLDFGKGFYVTSLREQADKWVERFLRFGEEGIVNVYELDEKVLSEAKVLRFETYSEEWLDFITGCRMGKDALDRLRFEKPNNQICLKKQEIIEEYLRFERSDRL